MLQGRQSLMESREKEMARRMALMSLESVEKDKKLAQNHQLFEDTTRAIVGAKAHPAFLAAERKEGGPRLVSCALGGGRGCP